MALHSTPSTRKNDDENSMPQKDNANSIAQSANNLSKELPTTLFSPGLQNQCHHLHNDGSFTNGEENDNEICFVKIVYNLSDGKYKAVIKESKLIKDKNRSNKWLLSLSSSNGLLFVTTFRMPLDLDTAFGKCIYNLSQNTPNLHPQMLINQTVTFTVLNNTSSNGKAYSNITAFNILN